MSWSFDRAIRRGNDVDIVITDGAAERSFTWGRSGQTWAQFRTMVKAEVVAHLAQLNASVAEQDVTADYE